MKKWLSENKVWKISKSMVNLKYKILIPFIYYTAIRMKDLLELQRKHFNLLDNIVYIKKRLVKIPPKLTAMIIDFFIETKEKENAFNVNNGFLKRFSNFLRQTYGITYEILRTSFWYYSVKKLLKTIDFEQKDDIIDEEVVEKVYRRCIENEGDKNV